MSDAEKKKRLNKVAFVLFTVAGVFWILGGLLFSRHYILYPFLGVLNLGIAYVLKQTR